MPTLSAQDIYRCSCERVFLGWLKQEPSFLTLLRATPAEIECSQDNLLFTLSALFALSVRLCGQLEPADYFDQHYKAYRSLLYKNGTNDWLKTQGGVVDVYRTHSNHALTVYRLTRWDR